MSLDVPAAALPSRKLRTVVLCLLGAAATMYMLLSYMDVSLSSFVMDFRFIADLAQQMLPPRLSVLWAKPLFDKNSIPMSLLQTLSMAFLATIVGGGIALVLAFFAATNTTPHPLVRLAVRTLLVVKRNLPPLIIILTLLIAVGIGPFAGVLTLTIGTIGTFGKLFADAIEHADKNIAESVQSVGSTHMQMIRFAVLPQVMPSFVANLFYSFDINLRAAIPLGVFGGGGIGFELNFADHLLHYKDVMAYTILILVMITTMERISDWVRKRIITQPQLITK